MRKIYITTTILITFILTSTVSRAQYFEVGMMGGLSAYQGDLLEKPVGTSNAHMAGGLFFRYDRFSHVAFRGSVNFGTISGNDAAATNIYRQKRNLSFRSRIGEISGTIEVNLINFEQSTFRKSKHTRPFTPILFAGVSMFRFNPQALYHGEWVNLQPLSTEGQGVGKAFSSSKKYSLTQIAFPMGFGFKFNLSPRFNLGAEAGMRITMTDYLDDVSGTYIARDGSTISTLTSALSDRSGEVGAGVYRFKAGDPRGNPAKKDSYYFAGVTLSYVIPTHHFPCFKF